MLATPVEVAVVKEVTRHAEHAGCLRLPLDRLELPAALAFRERNEFARICTGLRQHVGECVHTLDVEFQNRSNTWS